MKILNWSARQRRVGYDPLSDPSWRTPKSFKLSIQIKKGISIPSKILGRSSQQLKSRLGLGLALTLTLTRQFFRPNYFLELHDFQIWTYATNGFRVSVQSWHSCARKLLLATIRLHWIQQIDNGPSSRSNRSADEERRLLEDMRKIRLSGYQPHEEFQHRNGSEVNT